jgi:glycosyltransferase involved in cell wall biosynthesis
MAPNREAFFLFADEVWPLVREETKCRARVIFAGGFADEDIRHRAAACGIEIRAPLSDAVAASLFAEADLFLSPVQSGTGIKIKTLEAMAYGKPMIGFPCTFRGVPVERGVQAMIANTPADFAHMFEQLIGDEPRRRAIGLAARDFIRQHFDPAILGRRLANVYASIV